MVNKIEIQTVGCLQHPNHGNEVKLEPFIIHQSQDV